MRPYNFQTELEALRTLLGREASLDVKYIPVNHESAVPLLAMFGQYFQYVGIKNKLRRDLRLAMLSLWLNKKVGSSYDLTVYQCSTIVDFLEYTVGKSFGGRAIDFLGDSKAAVETGSLPFPNIEIQGRSMLP